MSFYPDVKDGSSPSALAQWFNQRSSFIKSYFVGERGPETKAMQTGTEIHALIEAGIIKAKHVYEHAEKGLSVEIAPGRVFRGRPDSHEGVNRAGSVAFVDYKSGKANEWKEKLPTDIKMKATAWLVWKTSGEPEFVYGFVEYFQTTWDPNQKKVVLVDGVESDSIGITYRASELREFTQVILKAMDAVNDFYDVWIKSTGEFVNKEDVIRYGEVKQQIDDLEMKLGEIGERILIQMEAGGEETHKTPIGTFFVKETKTYEYPATIKINYLDMGLVLEDADAIGAATKAAKKNYELINEPKSTSRKMQFRPAKEK